MAWYQELIEQHRYGTLGAVKLLRYITIGIAVVTALAVFSVQHRAGLPGVGPLGGVYESKFIGLIIVGVFLCCRNGFSQAEAMRGVFMEETRITNAMVKSRDLLLVYFRPIRHIGGTLPIQSNSGI